MVCRRYVVGIADGRPPPIGYPIPGATVTILDPADPTRVCAPGEPGELCIGGAGSARCYRDPALTAARFIPHPATRPLV